MEDMLTTLMPMMVHEGCVIHGKTSYSNCFFGASEIWATYDSMLGYSAVGEAPNEEINEYVKNMKINENSLIGLAMDNIYTAFWSVSHSIFQSDDQYEYESHEDGEYIVEVNY